MFLLKRIKKHIYYFAININNNVTFLVVIIPMGE